MNFFLITYNKNALLRNYDPLYQAIKTSSIVWWHHLNNTWIIRTTLDANQVYNNLHQHITEDDKLLVIQVFPNSEFQGWLPPEAWKWIENQFNQIY